MKLWALALFSFAAAPSALPQDFFREGAPVVFREELDDRRFLKTAFHRALLQGTTDPACARVLSTLLLALGEVGPRLHRRDDNFYLDPTLVQLLASSATTERFPALTYLAL